MSDELRLPDDLAAMEARLAGHAPPASGLNRDALMYRAGWAACETQQSTSASPTLKGGARGGIPDAALISGASSDAAPTSAPLTRPLPSGERGRIAAWSLASAALAASLAVMATMKVLSVDGAGTGVGGSGAVLAQAAVEPSLNQNVGANQPPAAAVHYVSQANTVRRASLGNSIFAQRLQRMRDAEARPAPDDSVARGEPSPPPKTALELRQELLPRRVPSFVGAGESAPGWPWSVSLWGAST